VELTSRQRGFITWLSLAPGREAYVSRSWAETAAELETLGMVEVLGGCTGLLASLSPAGVAYLTALEDKASDDRGGAAEVHG
jgi:hypothetical protein